MSRWPEGVSPRVRRPIGPPGYRLVWCDAAPFPLESALRVALEEQGIRMVTFSRRGLGVINLLVEVQGGYWTMDSSCAAHARQLGQEDTEDWLYGDIVEVQIPALRERIQAAGARKKKETPE